MLQSLIVRRGLWMYFSEVRFYGVALRCHDLRHALNREWYQTRLLEQQERWKICNGKYFTCKTAVLWV